MIKVDGNHTGTYDGILYIMSGDKLGIGAEKRRGLREEKTS